MSPPDSSSAEPSTPPEGEALVRLLREELIKTQLIVLELNDRVLEKETDKADALSILGRMELQLEQKMNRISELEAAHARQIAEARDRLQSAEADTQAKESSIQSLTAQLAAARHETTEQRSVTEELARNLALAKHSLVVTTDRLEQSTTALARSEALLAATQGQLNTIFASGLWRVGRPWRAIFGPKV